MENITREEPYEVTLTKVSNIIRDILNENNITCNEGAITNLAVHMTLVIQREMNNCYYTLSDSQLSHLKKDKLYPVAKQIHLAIVSQFQTKIHKQERLFIILYLNELSLLDLSFDFDYDVTDTYINQVLTETFITLKEQLNIEIKEDSDLYKGFTLHLLPAIERLENDEQSTAEPIISNESEIPTGYACAKILNNKIKKYYHKEFNQSELSFIALHFSVSLRGLA